MASKAEQRRAAREASAGHPSVEEQSHESYESHESREPNHIKKHILFAWGMDGQGIEIVGAFDSTDEARAHIPDAAHSAAVAVIRMEVLK